MIELPAFGPEILTDYRQSSSREWLETNGLGGYCSSTLSGAHSRGYHGMLVSATNPPAERTVLLSRLDETVTIGGQTFEIASRAYPGTISPEGFRYLVHYHQDVFPTFTFEVDGACIVKSVAMMHGSDTVIVTYDLIRAGAGKEHEVPLALRPFYAYRGYHSRRHACDSSLGSSSFEGGTLRFTTDTGLPDTFIYWPASSWHPQEDWYYRFDFAVERERGLPSTEDLFTSGTLKGMLKVGHPLRIVITSGTAFAGDPVSLVTKESQRRTELARRIPRRDSLTDILSRAADQFVVRRGIEGKTVIAGYPWFTDWGRDTMIALPGLCLVTGRFDEAKSIISSFLDFLDEGLIPNRFPDSAHAPEYNTVDATLWLFAAAWSYLGYTRDLAFGLEKLLPAFVNIIDWHEQGTKFQIRETQDGLLRAGSSETQLTWMDARANGVAVTPRQGKAVEINALWYNALRITCELSRMLTAATPSEGRSDTNQIELRMAGKAEVTKAAFVNAFWDKNLGYLVDCVEDDTGGNVARDTSLRPNQLLALSLPFPLVDESLGGSILEHVTTKLLTPFGLRTLSPDSSHYVGRYAGDGFYRDSAYHQGTAWAWMLGPYLTALTRFDRNGKFKARSLIKSFTTHLYEAGIGTVSEIFDGSAPHGAHGCFAQAWSVSEILRAYIEDIRID